MANSKRYEVLVTYEDGKRGFLSVKDKVSWSKKSYAQKHADDFAANQLRGVSSIEVREA